MPALTAPINFSDADIQKLPGYGFTQRQGLKSVQNTAAARGLGASGAAVKGAANFATGLSNQYFGDQFNRELAQRNQAYNQLVGTSQLGATAAGQTGQFGTITGQGIASNTIGGGNALAGGLTGAANVIGNAGNTIAGYNYANKLLQNGYVPQGMYKAA